MSTNIWIGDGRLTRDPEILTTANGTSVAKTRLAVDRNGTDDVDFFAVTAFGKTADAFATHLTKGRRVLIEGTLRQNTWTDKATDENRSSVEVIVDRFQFLDPKPQAA